MQVAIKTLLDAVYGSGSTANVQYRTARIQNEVDASVSWGIHPLPRAWKFDGIAGNQLSVQAIYSLALSRKSFDPHIDSLSSDA